MNLSDAEAAALTAQFDPEKAADCQLVKYTAAGDVASKLIYAHIIRDEPLQHADTLVGEDAEALIYCKRDDVQAPKQGDKFEILKYDGSKLNLRETWIPTADGAQYMDRYSIAIEVRRDRS